MRIFMSGITGLVGRALMMRLQRDGHEIIGWVRDENRARALLGAEVDFVLGPASSNEVISALKRSEAIIHLAGAPVMGRWNHKKKRLIRNSRVALTEDLVAAIASIPKRNRPHTIISAGAIGFYGDRGQETLTETSPIEDQNLPKHERFMSTLCRDWENAVAEASAHGLRTCSLRIGVVLAIDGGALMPIAKLTKLGLGGKMGNGKQYLPWIHIEDLVEMFIFALENTHVSGILNAVAPEAAQNKEFTKEIAAVLGRPCVATQPRWLMRAALGEAAKIVLASVRVVPERAILQGFRFKFADLEEALRDLLLPRGIRHDRLLAKNAVHHDYPSPADESRSYFEARGLPRYLLRSGINIQDATLAEQSFDFFSRAENLGLMTPRWMYFRIISALPNEINVGTEIDYKIKLSRLTMKWKTIVEAWKDRAHFIDAQHKGPYKTWWHQHHFGSRVDQENQIYTRNIMEDRVYYTLPLSFLGRIVHRIFVKDKLLQIFHYRNFAMRLRFGATLPVNSSQLLLEENSSPDQVNIGVENSA